jgi:hypothetical protein
LPTPDHGNFDIAIEIAEDTVAFVERSRGIPPIPPRWFNTPDMRGQITYQIRIDDIDLVTPNVFHLVLNLEGSTIKVTETTRRGQVVQHLNDPPTPIRGTVTIDDLLEMSNNVLSVDFGGNAAAGTPVISVNLDESFMFESIPIRDILVEAELADRVGHTIYQQKRSQLLQQIKSEITQHIRDGLAVLGVMTLVTPPPAFGVTSSNFRVGDRAIHVLYHTCGSGGNPALISRSNLLRRTSDGQPLDVAALILSNSGLLGCVLRPSVTTGLSLTPGGFVAGHPFLWFGRVPLSIPGGLPTGISGVFVTSIMAGIDGTNLRLLANVVADGVAGSFTVKSSVDTTLRFTATSTTGNCLTFAIAPIGRPAVRSDISIEAWVYVAAAAGAGFMLTAVLAAIDAFGGLLLDGIIARLITPPPPPPPRTICLPPGTPPVTIRAQSLGQSDAPTRTVTVSLPLGLSFTFADPFPANDMIINLR